MNTAAWSNNTLMRLRRLTLWAALLCHFTYNSIERATATFLDLPVVADWKELQWLGTEGYRNKKPKSVAGPSTGTIIIVPPPAKFRMIVLQ